MFLILRRCFRQMPSVFVRNFCIVPTRFFLLWFLPFLPPRVEVYDRILSFATRVWFDGYVEEYKNRFPEAVKCLEEGFEDSVQFYAFD